MEFSLSEEQTQLKDSLQRYLDKQYLFENRRRQIHAGARSRSSHWKAFTEFGLMGIGLPEEYGGLGAAAASAEETMVVMECFGRALVLEPYVSTVVMCAGLLRDEGSSEQCAAVLPAIIGGELEMALAVHERAGRYRLQHIATTARRIDDGFVLDGEKTVVVHGDTADAFLVAARTSGAKDEKSGISLFLLDKATGGLAIRGYPTNDGLRAAEISLRDARVPVSALVGVEGEAYRAIELAVDRGIAALCAEAVGAMDALVEQTLEYLKGRKQFGVNIGTFQVLQHRIVDMFVATEQARSMAMLAAMKVDSVNYVERRRVISASKSLVGQSARLVGQQAVQLHGGMGVTDELPISHYFKRLTAIDLVFGDASFHRAALGDLAVAA